MKYFWLYLLTFSLFINCATNSTQNLPSEEVTSPINVDEEKPTQEVILNTLLELFSSDYILFEHGKDKGTNFVGQFKLKYEQNSLGIFDYIRRQKFTKYKDIDPFKRKDEEADDDRLLKSKKFTIIESKFDILNYDLENQKYTYDFLKQKVSFKIDSSKVQSMRNGDYRIFFYAKFTNPKIVSVKGKYCTKRSSYTNTPGFYPCLNEKEISVDLDEFQLEIIGIDIIKGMITPEELIFSTKLKKSINVKALYDDQSSPYNWVDRDYVKKHIYYWS
ncbi:hypothetical protein [Leptospira levettii]|uniref:Lipoprotein n=1 Tax=Leptospira levettii TaxID=2023178 RepID=A0AAW5V7T5_9LEPT|nr:hypothetical protein [Leptospira levettii]MCW7512114.1 hypothetical protein [Leptospira levettii]MCW7517147.1 hypothetical protein [Leptospira levettii]